MALDDLKMHLIRAQQKMKAYADSKRHHEEFQEGDLVVLKLRPDRQQSLAHRVNEKLTPRYYGPFPMLQRIGQVAYKLQLPTSATIHPVAAESEGVFNSSPVIPPQLTSDLELRVEGEALLDVHPKHQGQPSELEVPQKWKSLPLFEATWEDFSLVSTQFPKFHLEDKVKVFFFLGGGGGGW